MGDCFFLAKGEKGFESCPHTPGELRLPAAGGREREAAISAAVEKTEGVRKPERFFGHRKVDCA